MPPSRAILALLCAAALPASAQSVSDRIHQITESSDYGTINAKPWHLKLNVTVYDHAGKNPQSGTIERWHSGADEKTVYDFNGAQTTSLIADGKRYETSESHDVPEYATTLFEHFLHPGPTEEDFAGATPEERPQSFGKEKFDCIMLSHAFANHADYPLGIFPTYCLIRGTDHLGVAYDFGGRVIVLRSMGKFMDHTVAISEDMMENGVVVATAKVESLTTFDPAATDFAPAAEQKEQPLHDPEIPGGVISGRRLTYVPPIYPQASKDRHAQGTVILHAILGRDGRIHDLRPVSYPDPDLVISALIAVRQWTYKPYLLNGDPVSIDTVITVNYYLNGR